MKNSEFMKKTICDQILAFNNLDLYDFITGGHPFKVLLCKSCIPLFGECPDSINDDALCKERFILWCEMDE